MRYSSHLEPCSNDSRWVYTAPGHSLRINLPQPGGRARILSFYLALTQPSSVGAEMMGPRVHNALRFWPCTAADLGKSLCQRLVFLLNFGRQA
jgi:hypothetical protein